MVDPLGCDWPIDEGCLDGDFAALEDDQKAWATSLASNTLRRLTGYRVGGCPVTLRPCKKSCAGEWMPYYGQGQFFPNMNVQGAWINSCGCNESCSCTVLDSIELPRPVGPISSVMLDGTELVAGDDYVLVGNRLVAVGDTVWPTCQNLTLEDSEVGTFSVTYLNGYPVDALGARAAGVLTMEYARLCGSGQCNLPTNVVSLTRPGLTMELESGAFPGGMTGIQQVDAYIALWNPDGLREDSMCGPPTLGAGSRMLP